MSQDTSKEDFPWHLGVYDAHCHPTDTMSSIPTIQSMKTRILTVMATRAEDQDLVLQAAQTHSVRSPSPKEWSDSECIVPCFGWHPWFSHQMYIDSEAQCSNASGELTGDSKISHYQSVLQPSRSPLSDEDKQILLSLPDPTPFSEFLATTRQHLERFPYALVGEIGLDRSFRIPESWTSNSSAWATRNHNLTPGGREGRRLTPFRCTPSHQKKICSLQLQLAAEMGRAVSVHGVQAHGLVFEVLSDLWKGHEKEVLSKRERKKRGVDHPDAGLETATSTSTSAANQIQNQEARKATPYPPRICLHSYSGNASNFKQYLNPTIPATIYASFSTAINLGDALDDETPESFEEVVKVVPDHLVLVESDLHTAGEEMDRRMENIVRKICKVKGWGLEDGVERLGRNWRAFAFGEDSIEGGGQ